MIAQLRLSGLTVRLRVDELESRSPASSLADLALLALAGAAESDHAEPVAAVHVEFAAGGFARDAADLPPLDAAKMADAQPAARSGWRPDGAEQPATGRPGDWLDIDTPFGQQPVFVLPQFAPSAAAPVSEATAPPPARPGEVSAATEPTTTATPPAVSAPFWPTTAQRSGNGEPPRTDPEIVALPYTGYMTAPNPTGYVSNMKVQEVDFRGDILVEADPGETAYPTEDGKPEWRDANTDGVIEDSQAFDPETEEMEPVEWSVPTAYVRNTTPVATAKFKVIARDGQGRGPTDVTIRGAWYGYGGAGLMFPPVTVPADGEYVTYPLTAATGPLPNAVDGAQRADISWAYLSGDSVTWLPAGYSSTELFVTLDQPAEAPVYHTAVMISTRASWGAADGPTVLDKTWNAFKTRQLTTATPAFQPLTTPEQRKQGKPLHYYKEWQPLPGFHMAELLRDGDGRCQAWAELMVATLRVHGIGASRVVVKPIDGKEGYVINSWDFDLAGSPVAKYPYGNIRQAGNGNPIIKVNGVWRYNWDTTVVPADVSHVTGPPPDISAGRGQGDTVPVALFADHALVRIGSENKLYDPSYGTGPFVGTDLNAALLAWEGASVAGFIRLEAAASKRMPGRAEDVIRPDNLGVLESMVQ